MLPEKDLQLKHAVLRQDTQGAENALGRGADIHFLNDWPLSTAIHNQYIVMIRVLLKKGAYPNGDVKSMLNKAIHTRNAQIVKLLLDAGANPDIQGSSPSPDVSSFDQQALSSWEFKNIHGDIPPLALAIELLVPSKLNDNTFDEFEIINQLLNCNVNVKRAFEYINTIPPQVIPRMNLFMEKSRWGGEIRLSPDFHPLVKLFLKYLAFPEEYLTHISRMLKARTYLRICTPTVKFSLWSWGFKYKDHAECSHQTLLHWAAALGRHQEVKKLLSSYPAYSYINAKDYCGYTALKYAAHYNRLSVFEEFIKYDLREELQKKGDVLKKVIRLRNNFQYVEALKEAVESRHYVLATKLLCLLKLYNFHVLKTYSNKEIQRASTGTKDNVRLN